MSLAPQPDRRRLRSGQAVPRLLSAGASQPSALPRRRAAARRGLQLGLVPAEQDVRARRHVQRLPRSAQRQAARRWQRGLRDLPPAGEVRHAEPPSSSAGERGCVVRRLPHADHDVHGGRPAARSQFAHSAAGSVRHARHAQRLHELPHDARRTLGRRAGGVRGTVTAPAADAHERLASTLSAADAGAADGQARLRALAADHTQSAIARASAFAEWSVASRR